jgi:cell wall-associated NlpC family hydrolase
MWLKWKPLQAAALAAAIGLPALVPLRVSAESPSTPQSVSHEEPGAPKSGSHSSPSPAAQKKSGVTVSSKSAHPVPNRHATRGEYLARTALSYRGAPYRFGGRSPRSGFDCSGLVQSVCARWGLYLPRVAHAQFHVGTPVKPKDLEPGDLVFFKNTYKRGISHVGIYIGDNYFIHAARPGKGVCVSRLEGYHKRHWAGARRLDLSKLPPVPGEETPPKQVIIQDTPDSPAQTITPSSLPAPETPGK